MGGKNFYLFKLLKAAFRLFVLQKYAVTITSQLGLKGKATAAIGDQLDTSTVEMLKDDQVIQLYELMLVAKGIEGDTITHTDINHAK